jgi:hypothetical protein
MGEIVVDPTREYYSADSDQTNALVPSREVLWVLLVQNPFDRDKLMKALRRQWTEVNYGESLKVLGISRALGVTG